MYHCLTAALLASLMTSPAFAEGSEDVSNCDQLIMLFIELGNMSGETVTEDEARAEVMSENPSEAECAAMLAMFEGQN
ncbi:MAG: hypothetical protein AAFY31_11360 [Pseudomonadota bacterium]